MKRRTITFAAAISCLISASLLPADGLEPSFVAYKPRVLVTPDNLPVMRWDQPGVDTTIDPSELDQLELCTPGVCPQEALDAGAAYYKVIGDLIAYYDRYGRLVGTAPYGQENLIANLGNGMAIASSSPFTSADEPQDIDQSLPGAIPGVFEVTPAGAATYSIPIEIPTGTAGVQPQLALTYSSQGGNGLLGVGWSISGLSAITRCPQTYGQDNNLTGLTFTSTDRFCLDGKRLMRTGGEAPYGAHESEYRTEIDTFSKITAFGDQGGAPRWFQVRTKSARSCNTATRPTPISMPKTTRSPAPGRLTGLRIPPATISMSSTSTHRAAVNTGHRISNTRARCQARHLTLLSASLTRNVLMPPLASARTHVWPRPRGSRRS